MRRAGAQRPEPEYVYCERTILGENKCSQKETSLVCSKMAEKLRQIASSRLCRRLDAIGANLNTNAREIELQSLFCTDCYALVLGKHV
jgi:hypothetical protein